MTSMRNIFAPFLLCFMLFLSITEAQAQKKSKPKGLAKELLGVWKLDDLDMKFDSTKATDEQKSQFAMIQAMMDMMKAQMKGSVTFNFKADGSYTFIEKEKGEETTGKWTLAADKLTMTPDKADAEKPESMKIAIANKILSLFASKEGEPTSTVMKFTR